MSKNEVKLYKFLEKMTNMKGIKFKLLVWLKYMSFLKYIQILPVTVMNILI